MLRVDCGKQYVSVLCVCWVGLLVGLRVEEMLLAYCLAFSFNLSVMCGSRLCLPCTFWFCEGAASWLVSASSDRHSMAVVWDGLWDGIDIEPTESWLLLSGWSFFGTNVVSVGLRWRGSWYRCGGMVRERALCGVCCCMLCVFWAEHWRLEGMFVLMKVLVILSGTSLKF